MSAPFDPLHFVGLGQRLAQVATTECELRTAVGRAYYGLFLLARDRRGITGRDRVHVRTINAVKSQAGYWATGCQLDDLRELRCVADYEVVPEKPQDRDWQVNWSRALNIVNHISPKLQRL
ncbi:MAG: hypothetical protein CEE40_05775 [Chloroflexi bacterium B3_Chlor]|nr:MAG: hypothetical protein CEE40_05775 [Chloroflexi bacterium B3_Chlor]